MANVNLGKVGLTPKDLWSSSLEYEKLDIVVYDGNSYIAKKNVPVGVSVTTGTEYWQLFTEKGNGMSVGKVISVTTTQPIEDENKLWIREGYDEEFDVLTTEDIDDTAGEGDIDKVWSADKLWKKNTSIFHPEFRQGSFQSKSTATAITMQKTVKIGVFDTIRINIDYELEEEYSFRIRIITLDVDEDATYGYPIDSICANRWAFETDNNNLYINLAFIKKSGAKSIAIQFAIKNKNGDLINITPSDFTDKITLELLNDTNYRYKKVLNDNEYFFDPDDFQTAVLSGSTGAVVFRGDSIRNRLSTKDLQYTKEDIKVIASNGYRFYVCYYNSADIFISNSDWQTQYIIPANSYYRIQFSNNDDSSQDSFVQTCDPLDLFYKFTYYKVNNTIKISQRFPEMRDGGLVTSTNVNFICTKYAVPFLKANRIVFHFDIDLPEGATKYKYQLCGYNVYSGETKDLTESFKIYNHITTEKYFDITNFVSKKYLASFGVAISAIDDENTYYSYRITNVNVNNIWIEYQYNDTYESNDYLIDSCLLKRELSVQGIGRLTYNQSFCKYGDYYYSTNGSNIAKQDKNFTIISDVELNVGHGNGFQLGDSHYGYISGWNDNKIYKIDLDNITITDIIILPTTGYTTSVVDERRGLVYIFRRETSPSTEEPYDYIVYDYINNTIIKNLQQYTVPFAAMQSADLYNDRIIVLNGTHSEGNPNGMRVYDLNANLVAEYHINTIEYEYEGVCVDRNSGDLLISINYNNNVFVVKPI